ncbi:MAG: hypothetical protein V3U09_07725 [Thermoplasmata archaeon]
MKSNSHSRKSNIGAIKVNAMSIIAVTTATISRANLGWKRWVELW